MTTPVEHRSADAEDALAARDWHHSLQAAVCDTLTPWEHGTVARASRYPSYFDYNVLRVEGETDMGFSELAAAADRGLAGLAHRRIDFEVAHVAQRLRGDFEAHRWKAMCLIWMRHRTPAPAAPPGLVEPVDYDLVHPLRVAWHAEDFDYPLTDGAYFAQSREVALSRGARVLAVLEDGEPIAFAQLIHLRDRAEITHVYVAASHRGRGLGTAVTCAAIAHAHDVPCLWICADEEDRPKELYRRLGFVGVWSMVEFLRAPGSSAAV
jgi:ribosomal protein S18 acetylase RimI-like enzyme